MIAASAHNYGKALELIDKASALDPDNPEYQAHIAKILVRLNRFQTARAAARQALQLSPTSESTLDTLGVCFSHLGEHEQAVQCFRAAVAIGTSNAEHYFNLASSLKFNGDFEGSEKAYDEAIRCNHELFKAYLPRSQLRQQSAERNHVGELERLKQDYHSNPMAQLHLGHALAKEYEDLERFDDAFDALVDAKRLRKQQIAYEPRQDQELFAAIRKIFDIERLGKSTNSDERPIFVFGMPRTGTTLVERILSAHPSVTSAGELLTLPLAVKRTSGTSGTGTLNRETIEAIGPDQIDSIADQYLIEASYFTAEAPHFVDKLPINLLYAGLIGASLPGARMICLRRGPLDTCLSNFRQLFAQGFPYYDYSYDLEHTGHYYVEFDRLIRHWAEQMPDQMLEVQYEGLIDDLEQQVERILDFLDLDWDAACVNFANNKTPVATASAVQVRSPIYQSARKRWINYEKHLQGLIDVLRKAGVNLGD
jgi:tetratricopeptide (TPR) repeat protein